MRVLQKSLIGVIALILMLNIEVFAANTDEVKKAITKHSIAMGVDPAIMLSIAKAESGFRQEARGGGGAVGVFQLMPSTARKMGINPYNLEENIKGGIVYYKNLYNMFGSMELAVAAYNAGPGAIKSANYNIPHCSRGFVSKIMSDYKYYKNH